MLSSTLSENHDICFVYIYSKSPFKSMFFKYNYLILIEIQILFRLK